MNAITKTRSKLKGISPDDMKPTKPKVLVYGKPGVGKTWTSLDFPSVYYIDTEGGANLPHYKDKLKASGGVYVGIDQGSILFETIIGEVQTLATESHPYRTLVIDSISKVYNNAIAMEAERLMKEGKKNEYAADKKPATGAMRRLVSWLTRLDMNVILIAHQKDEWGLKPNGEREVIGETFDAWDRLEYELHLCLQVIKAGPSRKARVRKTRLQGFPDAAVFDWSYAEFAERYGRDVMETEAKQIDLASHDQIAEINRLLGVVKVADDYLDKCLTKAEAATIDELDAEKADKIIASLKERLS